MKKILRFLLVPVFVGTSAMTVVACGTSEQVWNEDIISSAIGRMQDHTFNMKEELNLSSIPNNGDQYTSLSGAVRSRILSYYSNLVKEAINWDYPTVAVNIVNNSTFLQKYGPNVESRIDLTAHLTYRNLSRDKKIVVKIKNDSSSDKDKADGIASALSSYLTTNPIFNFSSLFKDGLTSDEAASNGLYGKITAPLRFALLKNTNETQPIPVIDVAGTDISVEKSNTSGVIYNLNSNAVNAADKRVEGTFTNLNLRVNYQNATDVLENQTFKVAQEFSQTNNQVAEILNQGQQALKFAKTSLPSEAQMLSDYDTDNSLRTAISSKLFDQIKIIYPTAKMNGTDSWAPELVKIENAASSPYIKDTETSGHFTVNFKFEFNADSAGQITATVPNIKINIYKQA